MNQKLSNWKKIYDNYEYSSDEELKGQINEQRLLVHRSIDKNQNLIKGIVLWKLDREIKIFEEDIDFLYGFISSLKSPEEVIASTETHNFISKLTKQKGFRLAMASSVLHFFNPKCFPIIDRRAYRTIYKENKYKEDIVVYISYIKDCLKIAKHHDIPFEIIDKILYQYDKERNYL
ncbi:hypothetical protein KQY10_06945 [Leptospira interrogans]|uniref:Uncharacterized protein n=1 Tax=Leptospira interrogans serovar Hardjo str. Norma TaxID=1279460 RepID=A0A0M3TMC5_LEPIR|nr:hypothetical protein [Leptospira interrogans]ALE40605.1 hypothetical protein G436_3454 [Leptospira interrogans serovar Hardjo str. Norma]ALN99695.1 hypothetical protein LIH_04920 [Leptospira interrogans serovar Hardjo-prajitno]EKO96621.1 hypothetical protein LEP1GSC057_4230 [Leptospira interrogans str. Brem 329]MCD1165350.1 hypothetical protein [Leptospira interrogans]MCH1887331.1 hypothetical protein [Leptospira interrogans]